MCRSSPCRNGWHLRRLTGLAGLLGLAWLGVTGASSPPRVLGVRGERKQAVMGIVEIVGDVTSSPLGLNKGDNFLSFISKGRVVVYTEGVREQMTESTALDLRKNQITGIVQRHCSLGSRPPLSSKSINMGW